MEKLIHLLIPRESNNHRAKILHNSSLLVLASFLIIFQIVLNFIPKIKPDILGFSSQISINDVVSLTNQRRVQAGLPALVLNQVLSNAAYTKARDMIDRDYWAHTAPDGQEPWSFFSKFGYKYRYAGENLARDFSSASAIVDAWMNSPTHRDNILNPKYKEIGIGITEGDLAGLDTTIVVQFFGATYADKVAEPIAQAVSTEQSPKPVVTEVESPIVKVPTASPEPIIITTPLPVTESVIITPPPNQEILISPFNTTRTVSITTVVLLLAVFVVDAYLVSRRKISRITGRTVAHLTFLLMILLIILILRSGKIL